MVTDWRGTQPPAAPGVKDARQHGLGYRGPRLSRLPGSLAPTKTACRGATRQSTGAISPLPTSAQAPGPSHAGAPPRALVRAWHCAARPKMRRIAPQRAAAVPWHRPGRARRTLPRRRLGLPAGMLLSSIVRSGRSARHDQPDLLRRLQESPAKTRHVPVPSAGVKGVGKGTSFLVRALRIRLSARLQQVMPATPPCAGAGSWLAERDIVPLRCCILLLYKARELWAQDFEFISLTWVELRGFEPLTSCMPCKSGNRLARAAVAPTCELSALVYP